MEITIERVDGGWVMRTKEKSGMGYYTREIPLCVDGYRGELGLESFFGLDTSTLNGATFTMNLKKGKKEKDQK